MKAGIAEKFSYQVVRSFNFRGPQNTMRWSCCIVNILDILHRQDLYVLNLREPRNRAVRLAKQCRPVTSTQELIAWRLHAWWEAQVPVGNSIESLPFLEPFIKMVYMNVLIVFQSQMQAEVRRYLVYKTTGHDRSFDRTITTLSTDDDIRAPLNYHIEWQFATF